MSSSRKMPSREISRQNSSPHLSRPKMKLKTPHERSKTPPAKFNSPLEQVDEENKAQQFFTLPRNASKKHPSSSESLSKLASTKSSNIQDPSKEMDIKYNLYCQANLIALHTKSVLDENAAHMIDEIVSKETDLLVMDEKVSELDTNLEKKQFFEKTRNTFLEEIRSCEKIISDIDENKLDEYIRIMEQDLGIVQLKNFDLPKDEEEAKEVLKSLREIDEVLNKMPEVDEKVLPFTELHSSVLEVKRNVQLEKELENTCEKNLKLAEKMVYDACFEASLNYRNISKLSSQN